METNTTNTREIRETVTIGGRHLLRQYNELRSKGYTTIWTGEGKICMQAPALMPPANEQNEEVARRETTHGRD